MNPKSSMMGIEDLKATLDHSTLKALLDHGLSGNALKREAMLTCRHGATIGTSELVPRFSPEVPKG
jgi:hypothetical protein